MNQYYDYEWMRGYNPTSSELFKPDMAFRNGNLFSNLYQGYKNYKPASLNASSEKERKMMELSEICFDAHELNLYLDLHPEDRSMFLLFQDYQKRADQLKNEYEEKYGPLCIDSEMKNNFTWSNTNWPWEGKNV